MACYTPLKAIKMDLEYGTTEKGKNIIKVISKAQEAYMEEMQGIKTEGRSPTGEYIDLPCGKCIGCRLDYSREWATRCVLEAKLYKDNYFITLTYAENYLPLNKEKGIPTLEPEDLTKFIKDLRRYYSYHYQHDNIRFYAAGEYGEKYQRPHYHVIFFNLPIKDLTLLSVNHQGEALYRSATIEKIWKKGIVTIGSVTWNSAAYVARYMTKKRKGKNAKQEYIDMGRNPEFSRMSRNPGIAREYYDRNKDKIYKYDEIIIADGNGKALKAKPSKYYDRLYEEEAPYNMEIIKLARKTAAEDSQKHALSRTDLNKKEYLNLQERNKLEKLKFLPRNIES